MKRWFTAWLGVFLLLGALTTAAASDVMDEQSKAMGLDRLERAAGEFAPEGGMGDLDLESGLQGLLNTGNEAVSGVLHKAVRSGVLLLVVVLLCALAKGAYLGEEGSSLSVVPVIGALAITAIAVADVESLIGMGRQALERMDAFSRVLLPTMAVATAASGAPGGASARQMATMLFSSVLMTVIARLLLPLCYAYIAACVAHAAIGNEGLKRIAGALKWVVTSVLTILLIGFVGYLTVSGVIAGTADALAIKTAKFAVSSMVPVVGGILSDASETVLAGAGILKNTVGVFGMLVVLSICLVPFLQLGIHYLTYKLTAALAATVAEGRVAGLIDGIGGAFGLILGMTGASALLLLISMVSAVSMAMP